MRKIILIIFLNITNHLVAQISRVEPPNWWMGMKLNQITLLVYGQDIQNLEPVIQYQGVKITKIEKVENPNYLFITLNIESETPAGVAKIIFKKNNKIITVRDFPLLKRADDSANRASFSSKDAIMLIVPDRFANGNEKNDNTTNTIEKVDRSNESGRHGGDIQGIINHLDYIQSMGFTQIWNTPLVENNMPKYSYHGYAASDFYKIDSRFGTNEDFLKLVQESKKRNIGVIWDVVLNHCGSEYYFIKDPPCKDWLNFQQTQTRTNHLKSTLFDPYATTKDKELYTDGWFDTTMPDLNQKNPLMANFLIQNTIWWIEYAGLSGIREDTFSYADKHFLASWTKTVIEEYPKLNIVGEEMTIIPEVAAYWQKGKNNPDGYQCYLPTLMDFSLTENLVKSLTTTNNWWSTWKEVYQSVGQDYIFPNPDNLLIFPDNHDMDRMYSRLNKDFEQWKMAMVLYTTMRGIPQFYYGTELLFTNETAGNDGQRRADFYGGWNNDAKNAISGLGLNDKEIEAQLFLKNILNWRKNATVIHNGKFVHYAPTKNDAYVYFRYNNNKKVMVILNKSNNTIDLEMENYNEMIPANFKAKEIITNQEIQVIERLKVKPKTAMILEIE